MQRACNSTFNIIQFVMHCESDDVSFKKTQSTIFYKKFCSGTTNLFRSELNRMEWNRLVSIYTRYGTVLEWPEVILASGSGVIVLSISSLHPTYTGSSASMWENVARSMHGVSKMRWNVLTCH